MSVIGKLSNSSRDRFSSLVTRFKQFAYRHAWVEAHIKNAVAFQLRAMRKAKGWDQRTLAEKALGNPDLQSMISRYENPDYGRYSLRTLLDLAKVFDVGLVVRFAPFSELIKWEDSLLSSDVAIMGFEEELKKGRLSPSSLSPVEYKQPSYQEMAQKPIPLLNDLVMQHQTLSTSGVIFINEHRREVFKADVITDPSLKMPPSPVEDAGSYLNEPIAGI